MREKIENFIKNNKLKFTKGRRNSDLVIICGYAQHLDATLDDLHDVLHSYYSEDSELEDEAIRVWVYAEDNDYYKWWRKPANTKEYVLS